MMNRPAHVLVLVCNLVVTAGCSYQVHVASVMRPSTSPPTAAVEMPRPTAVNPNRSALDEIAKGCRLDIDTRRDGLELDHDSVRLMPSTYIALGSAAECITDGPVERRMLGLIERADPRGIGEGSADIGARHADSVGAYLATYLVRLGVVNPPISEASSEVNEATADKADPPDRVSSRRYVVTVVTQMW